MAIIKSYSRLPLWLQFLGNITILSALWFVFFTFFRRNLYVDYLYEEGIFYLTQLQLKGSKFVLELLGYKVFIFGKIIRLSDTTGVLLDRGCLGRNTLGLFLAFIWAYPSGIRRKIGVSLWGSLVFIFMNILRIVALAITQECCPEKLDFNHHVLFKYIVYGVIFMIWYFWLKSLSKQQRQP